MIKGTRTNRSTRRLLTGAGQRATRQRALLLEVLQQEGKHLDADELYRLARRKQPRLSLSTVYRTLQLLKKMGLVEEHHFSEEHHHYEARPKANHQHLECLGCGRIVEFDNPLTHELKQAVAREHDFTVTGLEMYLAGFCAACRRKGKTTNNTLPQSLLPSPGS